MRDIFIENFWISGPLKPGREWWEVRRQGHPAMRDGKIVRFPDEDVAREVVDYLLAKESGIVVAQQSAKKTAEKKPSLDFSDF